ncbi:MAG: flavin prenyltransferase UbiX [Eikenella sp.]|nr:flavin prenyltransferase UbiX [Eikenella sp.]
MLYPAAPRPVRTVTLAWTGASGLPYGLRLLECLVRADVTVWLLYSQAAQIVAQQECGLTLPSQPAPCRAVLCERFGLPENRLRVFGRDEWFAPPASGSNPADAMVICPASMGAVAAVAAGTSDHLLERAADVCIKERRPLVVVPRETPLSAIHLENLLKLARLGVTVLPPAPGFYTHPQSVADMVDFVVARILDQLGVAHALLPRWGEAAEKA